MEIRVSLTACLVLFFAPLAGAETLHVRVIGVDQEPVADVAVFVKQRDAERPRQAPAAAVMDQRDSRFVPHLLVVQTGAPVAFPNSDSIAHHVYSFSKPNNFELPLYKGTPPEPVDFAHEGVVTIGCNIHDSMLGYIVVVDTDVFAMTDENGEVRLDVDGAATGWEVSIWSPRIRDSRDPIVRQIQAGEALATTFVLSKKLRPAHDDYSESVSWDDY